MNRINGDDFKRAVSNMRIPDGARERAVQRAIAVNQNKFKKENGYMSKRKLIIAAAAALTVICAAAYAAGGRAVSWFSSSSSKPDYRTLPTAEQCEKDVGFVPILVNSFENGYTFRDGSIVDNNLKDEDGSSVEKFKSFDFRYEKDGDVVYFNQEKYDSDLSEDADTLNIGIGDGGVKFEWHSYKNKVVPADYKLTEEDKRAQESGELVFSYGSDKVETTTVNTVSWEEDGIHYSLMQMGGRLSEDELRSMADEVADKK